MRDHLKGRIVPKAGKIVEGALRRGSLLLATPLFISIIFAGLFASAKAATFIVTTTADSNDGACDANCSLREAIGAANASPSDDLITFDTGTFSTPQTIRLDGTELTIEANGALTINGNAASRVEVNGNNFSRILTIKRAADVTIRHLTFSNGTGFGFLRPGFGGAILNSGGRLKLEFSRITNNRTTLTANCCGGGGIYVDLDGHLEANRCNIDNNFANGDGGAISGNLPENLVPSISVTINSSTIYNNRASSGGAAFNFGIMVINNSTISGNRAAGIGAGGAIVNEGLFQAKLKVFNSTIAFNSGSSFAGGILSLRPFGEVTLQNSIIANNSGVEGSNDIDGPATSNGYNLIGDPAGATITGILTGNIIGLDPQLLPLRNNGGNTLTHALRRSSPAIDKGSAIAGILGDQRGSGRPFDFSFTPNAPGGDGSDIGSFERQASENFSDPAFDFDADGKTDLSLFNPLARAWTYQRSSGNGNSPAIQFGLPQDLITPADFTGDGKTDIAVFRSSSGEWFILRSEDQSFYGLTFGASGDIPSPADYDGDGKADVALFRPSSGTWYVLRSLDGQASATQFGAAGDKPIPADYDGDSKQDIAILRQGSQNLEWWRLNSSNGEAVVNNFGTARDRAIPADYTGDGKADVAIFRPSNNTWFVLRSEDLNFFAFPFGAAGDIPAPGDYDGDGRFDSAVFRPSQATWFVNQSSGSTLIRAFGANGDQPIPGAFIP